MFSGFWQGPMYASGNDVMAYTDTFLPLAIPFRLVNAVSGSPVVAFNVQPLVDAANAASKLVATLQKKRAELAKVTSKAEALHDNPVAQATYLTVTGCDTMGEVRAAADALELVVGDEYWPLPRYREMLFPV